MDSQTIRVSYAARMILLIDNYDSFVHNLARYLRRLGQVTQVVRNDWITPQGVAALAPDAIVLSPGPCTPQEAGHSLAIVRELSGSVPILGVCLGHQTIGAALGGNVIRAPIAMHGRASCISHTGRGIFADLPSALTVGRYHSLVVQRESLPSCLEITAWTPEGTVMAIAHRHHVTCGVQFHPESVLTDCGTALLANFLRIAGIAVAPTDALGQEVRPEPTTLSSARPLTPVAY